MIYEMEGGIAKEHITINQYGNKALEELAWWARKGKTQFIDKEPIMITPSKQGGVEYPDFITRPLCLVSERLKQFLDKNGIDYIFYKPVLIVDKLLEEEHQYYLAVIPEIEVFLTDDTYIEEKAGRYQIFRDVIQSDRSVYVTSKLRDKIKRAKFEGIYFYNVE